MHNHTYLIKRNSTYYIRMRIPSSLQYLIAQKQFCYSLKTNNFYEALDNLHLERYKMELKMRILRAINMDIQDGKLVLDEIDINKMVKHRLELLDDVLNNHFEDIMSGVFNKESLSLFPQTTFSEKQAESPSYSKKDYELDCVEIYIKEYLQNLKTDKKTHFSTYKLLERLEKDDIELISRSETPQWQKDTMSAMRGLEKYTMDKLTAVKNDIPFNKNIPPRIYSCLQAINAENSKNMNDGIQSKTKWEKVFKEFAEYKIDAKGTTANTVEANKVCIETAFEILGKQYVESITYKDCYKVCNNIGKVPLKWKEKYKGVKLATLIKQEHDKCLSKTSIKKYLRTFKEFMLFCKKRRYTFESFSEDIEVPKKKEVIEITGFTEAELKKIFNAKTYPRKISIDYGFRYWIPLIALYSGMRLNEICQLYVDDCDEIDDVHFFNLTDERKDQHLKNKQSKRCVPIHPKLIEFGLLDYIKKVRKEKRDRLFYQFKYSEKNHYANMMSGWFARYLKSIGIDDRSKVFHSFRHTVKPYLRDAKISQEYQNAICGWGTSDIGEKVYGGQVPIKILYDEISKLEYPFLEKNLKTIRNKNKGRL